MLKNFGSERRLLAASTSSGVLALVGLWMILVRAETHLPHSLDVIWILSYGIVLGLGSSAIYFAGGGKSLESAVSVSLVGTVLVTSALAVLAALSTWEVVPPYAVPLVAVLIFPWIFAIAAIVLVTPATVATLAIYGALQLVRRVIRDSRHAVS